MSKKQTLPQAHEIERAVLGAIILGASWIPGVSRDLFSNPLSQTVWDFLDEQKRAGESLDLVSLIQAAPQRLISEIVLLPGICTSLDLVPAWIRRLKEIQKKRALVIRVAEAQAAIEGDDWDRARELVAPVAERAGSRSLPDDRAADPALKDGLRARKKARAAIKADFILREDPRWAGRLWWDDFRKQNMLGSGAFQDEDCQRISIWLSESYGIQASPETLRPVIAAISKDHSRDPLIEYLKGLLWDGQKRLDSWLIRGVGAPDTELSRMVGRRWAIQAVARALSPGCKADAVLVLTGAQGVGKSTAIQALAGSDYFSESPIQIGDVRGLAQVYAAWIHELGELASLSKKTVEETKQFLTTCEDRFIPLYGRSPVCWRRRCVFTGTTNDSIFLTDPTGERRYWPVQATSVDLAWIRSERDQIWAEAVAAYSSGESYHLGQEEERLIAEDREQYRSENPWKNQIFQWLSRPATQERYNLGSGSQGIEPLTMGDVLGNALSIPIKDQTTKYSIVVGRILVDLGYTRIRTKIQGDLIWRYEKKPG